MSESHDSHDSHNSPEYIKKTVRRYMLVFGALLVGTVVTVWANTWKIDSTAMVIAIALFIASVKAFLVAGYFMHLMSEKKMIYGILLATVFFFAGLMILTLWSMEPNSLVHIRH